MFPIAFGFFEFESKDS
jgi:hypothetical protein